MTAPAWLPSILTPVETRLAVFRKAHPDVTIANLGYGDIWQARWDDDYWETTITRDRLPDLLDKLDKIFKPADDTG